MKFRSFALALLAALGSEGAATPPIGPHRTTEVRYHIENAQSMLPADFTILFAPGGERARLSFAGQPGYLLLDLRAKRVVMVMDNPRLTVRIPTPPLFAPYFDWRNALDYTPGALSRAAGQSCRMWSAADGKGRATLCLSADGVPLWVRAQGKDGSYTSVAAVAVRLAPDDPAAFIPPGDAAAVSGGFSPFAFSGTP